MENETNNRGSIDGNYAIKNTLDLEYVVWHLHSNHKIQALNVVSIAIINEIKCDFQPKNRNVI